MKINLRNVKIRDAVENYINDQINGVKAYGGKLDIRPPYQREFVYGEEKRNAVIETIKKNFPLNVMYWVDNENDTFEVLDGQQRLISICEYIYGVFNVDSNYFHSLTDVEKNKILDYELMVYFCSGTDQEKLDWFKTINIAGEKLEEQELRNAVYVGPWLLDAKRYFSSTNQGADKISKNFHNVVVIRQKLLELALKWICLKEGSTIESYMSKHQFDKDAIELWNYFRDIVNWIEKYFVDIYSDMKKVDWGILYIKYKDIELNANDVSDRIKELRKDSEVQSHSGIYEYILSGNEKTLNLRAFEQNDKTTKYEQQNGLCAICKKHKELTEMEGDHILPWSKGGKTKIENLQMLCRDCNRTKTNK
jgi:hypothetical protein